MELEIERTLARSLTGSLTCSFTHSLTPLLTDTLIHSISIFSFTHSMYTTVNGKGGRGVAKDENTHFHPLTILPSHSLPHSLSVPLPLSLYPSLSQLTIKLHIMNAHYMTMTPSLVHRPPNSLTLVIYQ